MTQRRIYQNKYPYFITINTLKRIPLFDNIYISKIISKIIIETCEIYGYVLYSFCIMPDHLHLLIKKTTGEQPPEAAIENKNISELIHTIKSFSFTKLRQNNLVIFKFWQNRFHFKIVTSDREFKNKLLYIKNNPLKLNLSKKYFDEPYMFL